MSSHRPLLEDRFVASVPTDRWDDLERSSFDHASEVPFSQAYNEEAFRYFLDIERKRSEISNRPFLLLLIDLKKHAGGEAELQMDAGTADEVFAALSLCLRETDFVGWYRDGRVAGAVLTQHGEVALAEISNLVSERVVAGLGERVAVHVANRLQVRVYQLPASSRLSQS